MLVNHCLTMVTRQRWRAAELSRVVDVTPDLGMDTSAAADPGVVLWCPGAWAAAAVSRYPNIRLSSAGPRWLDDAGTDLTGRNVSTVPASDIGDLPGQVFAKLPETKHEKFPAEVRDSRRLAEESATLPADEPVQLQDPVTFSYEVRCWVLHGKVVAHASYFGDVDRGQWKSVTDPVREEDAARWLFQALTRLPDLPPAAVVDVGWVESPVAGDSSPGWRVVEANAAWSSDWYESSDMDAVVGVITASQGPGVADRWLWYPSPLLTRAAVGLARR